ncbi:MAG TPA: hypothetical protein V6D12_07735 [Candidatus Obscuribacterales bacterium]
MQEPDRPVVGGGKGKQSYLSEKGGRDSAENSYGGFVSDTMLRATKMKEIKTQYTSARLTTSEYEVLRVIASASGRDGTPRQTVSSLIRDAVRRIYIENFEAG